MKKEIFNLTNLIILIVVIAVLAAALVPTAVVLSKKINDLSSQLDAANGQIATLDKELDDLVIPEAGLTAEQVLEIVNAAIAGVDKGLTEAEVKAIVDAAIAGVEKGLSKAEVEKLIADAIAAIKMPEAGLTEAEVKAIVDAAIAGADKGLTEAEVKAIVDAAIAGVEKGLSKAEVEKLIADAIAQLDVAVKVDSTSIEEKLAAGGKYILTEDTVLTNVSIATGVVSALDLNGKTLTIDSDKTGDIVSVLGTLTIANGDVVIERPEGEEAIYMNSGICVEDNANLVIENANITADRLWNIENIGTTTITGSVITVTGGFGIGNEGTVVIENSKLVADGEATTQVYCVGGTMDIINTEFVEGSNFKEYYLYAPIDVFYEGTKVTLDNVTVTTSNDVPNVHAGLGCEVVIKSGTFNDALLCTTDSTITLYGGTFCGVEFDNITEASTGFFNEGAKITKADKAWVISVK